MRCLTIDMDLWDFWVPQNKNTNKSLQVRAMFGWSCTVSDIPLEKKRRWRCSLLAQIHWSGCVQWNYVTHNRAMRHRRETNTFCTSGYTHLEDRAHCNGSIQNSRIYLLTTINNVKQTGKARPAFYCTGMFFFNYPGSGLLFIRRCVDGTDLQGKTAIIAILGKSLATILNCSSTRWVWGRGGDLKLLSNFVLFKWTEGSDGIQDDMTMMRFQHNNITHG